jgi:hypothetical protein
MTGGVGSGDRSIGTGFGGGGGGGSKNKDDKVIVVVLVEVVLLGVLAVGCKITRRLKLLMLCCLLLPRPQVLRLPPLLALNNQLLRDSLERQMSQRAVSESTI